MSTRSHLEHARQMAAIHQARARLGSLTREERDAHHEMGKWYDRDAVRLQKKLDQVPRPGPRREAGR